MAPTGVLAARWWARGASAALLLVAGGALAEPPASATDASSSEPLAAPPRLRTAATVGYPAGAIGGAEVVLELVIGVSGEVEGVAVVQGEPPFREAAAEAAARWRFEPATRRATPVAARIRFVVRFTEPAEHDETRRAADSRAAPAAAEAVAAPEPIAVTVSGHRHDHDHAAAMTRAEVRQLPGAFGDPFRAIDALPGVTPVVSGAPYFYVRGAPPGNVGYYFDGVRVPALFHAGIGPAVIHPAFADDVKLYPGPYPARYGRFAGAIVSADAAKASERARGEAAVRLLDAGGMVETPFAGGRGDVALGGRYSYAGALLSIVSPENALRYWDYQARAGYDLSPRDRVSVFAFGAYDYAGREEAGQIEKYYEVRFHRLDARYDRRLASGGRLRLAATIGDDRTAGNRDAFFVKSSMTAARVEYAGPLGAGVELRAGADINADRYDFAPSRGGRASDIPAIGSHDDTTLGARADLVLGFTDRITVVPGLRFDVYRSQGRTLPALEPRVSARFRVGGAVTLFHDFGIAHQLPSFAIPIPGVQPQIGEGLQLALQSSAGVEAKLPEDVTAIATLYQSALLNGTDQLGIAAFRVGDSPIASDARSRGRSFGVELSLKRSLTKRVGGMLAYTLARSVRELGPWEGPSAADRTHVLNAALSCDLGRGWRAGVRAVVYTGIPAKVAYVEAARDPPRVSPFYRFDWRLEKRWTLGEGGAYWALVFEFLNSTVRREVLEMSCSARYCRSETIGPIALPNVGIEASF